MESIVRCLLPRFASILSIACGHRIAGFPAAGRTVLKNRVDAISLAQTDDFRRDSDLFLECARDPETQHRIGVAMTRGFQTRNGEMALGSMVGGLVEH